MNRATGYWNFHCLALRLDGNQWCQLCSFDSFAHLLVWKIIIPLPLPIPLPLLLLVPLLFLLLLLRVVIVVVVVAATGGATWYYDYCSSVWKLRCLYRQDTLRESSLMAPVPARPRRKKASASSMKSTRPFLPLTGKAPKLWIHTVTKIPFHDNFPT